MPPRVPPPNWNQSEFLRRSVHRSNEVRLSAFELLRNPDPTGPDLAPAHSLTQPHLHLVRLALRALAHDPYPDVRWHSLDALGTYGTALDRSAALANLDHPDPTVRLCAVELLGIFHRRRDERHVLPRLEDPYYATRIYAAQALDRILGEDTVPYLSKHLESESDLEVQTEILGILANRDSNHPWRKQLEDLAHHLKTTRAIDRHRRVMENLP